jgi:hypothetical protein
MAKIQLTDNEIRQHILEGLRNLEALCRDYDGGRPYVAFAMATEVHRILIANNLAKELTEQRVFRTQVGTGDENLMPETKLIWGEIKFNGIYPEQIEELYAKFVPVLGREKHATHVAFDVWWAGDTIFREGASWTQDGQPKPRFTLTRKELVKMMRDKLGAHLDTAIPEELDHLQRALSFGADLGFVIPRKDQDRIYEVSIANGLLPVIVSPGAAMMRQIAFEVLEAYAPELST